MAGDVKVAVASGAIPTTGGGTADFTITDFGTPKACIIIVTWDTADDTSVVAESRASIGFSDFTDNFHITHQDEDASAKVDCDALKSGSDCYSLLLAGGSQDVRGSASTITDGVRLTNRSSPTPSGQAALATVIMFGGADLTVALASTIVGTTNGSTATFNGTGTDGNDRLIFFIGTDITSEDSSSSGIENSFGVAHITGTVASPTIVNRSIGWASDDKNAAGSPASVLATNRCLCHLTETGVVDWGLEVTDLLTANTFEVTSRDAAPGSNMEVYTLHLDLNDRSGALGSKDSPTTTSDWTETGLGFTPQYVGLALTGLITEDSVSTIAAAGPIGISSNTGSSEETFHGWYNEDNTATTDTNNNFRSRVVDFYKDNTDATKNADMQHSSFDSGGWTYTVNSEDINTPLKWFYWAIEEAAVVGAVTSLSFTDGMFIPDQDERGQEHQQRDNPLLQDDRFSDLLKTILDPMLVADVDDEAIERTRYDLESLLLRDTDQRTRESFALDTLELLDARFSEVVKNVVDAVLLADTVAVEKIKSVSLADGLMLDDQRFSQISRTALDKVLILSIEARITERNLQDKIQLADAALVRRVRTRLLLDTVQVDDQRLTAIDKTIIETLLLADRIFKAVDKYFQDRLLLLDPATRDILKSFFDPLLLVDAVTAEVTLGFGLTQLSFIDGLFVLDQALRDRSHIARDSLLLADDAIVQAIRGLTALLFTDGLFVRDQAQRIRTHIDSEGIEVDSRRRSEALVKFINAILLSDSSLSEITRTRLILDSLLLSDQRTSKAELNRLDLLLLDSFQQSTQEHRPAIETVLLSEERFSERVIGRTGKLLLDEALTKIQALLRTENLLIGDSFTRLVTEVLVQALVFAELRSADLLGISTAWDIDLLASIVDHDMTFLGESTGWVPLPDVDTEL